MSAPSLDVTHRPWTTPYTATVYQNGDDFWIGNIQKAAK
jgi:hypothetical protein